MRKKESKKRSISKIFCFVAAFVVIGILVGCSLPGRLTVQDVRQETVKTIYVDTWVWYDRIPFNLAKWFHLQVFKPLAAQKLQEYFEKAGWVVTNKNLEIIPQKIQQIPCPLWRKRCRDYETWLDMYMWTNKKRMTPEDIRAYIKAKYALFFAYYPSPKNVKEYEIKIILGKLKDPETMRKVFEKIKKQGYEVEFSTLCLKTFAKDLWIKKPLIFTVKKFEDYVATRVFMILKEQGMIGYRNVGWKTDWKIGRRNAFIEVRKGENVQQKNIQQKALQERLQRRILK